MADSEAKTEGKRSCEGEALDTPQPKRQALADVKIDPMVAAATAIDLPSGDADGFRDSFLQRCKQVVDENGGLQNYLMQRFDTEEKRKAFASQLRAAFPPWIIHSYTAHDQIPNVKGMKYTIHIADCAFDQSASTKPPTRQPVAHKLLDMIITAGVFNTAGGHFFIFFGPALWVRIQFCGCRMYDATKLKFDCFVELPPSPTPLK